MSIATAVVWLLSGRRLRGLALTDVERLRLRELMPTFIDVGRKYGIAWPLLAGIARRESAFDAAALNPASGAMGLMQIMPFHREALGWVGPRAEDWRDPRENIEAGARVLLDSGYGRRPLYQVLAAYSGHVTWLRSGGQKGPSPDSYILWVLGSAAYIALAHATGEL